MNERIDAIKRRPKKTNSRWPIAKSVDRTSSSKSEESRGRRLERKFFNASIVKWSGTQAGERVRFPITKTNIDQKTQGSCKVIGVSGDASAKEGARLAGGHRLGLRPGFFLKLEEIACSRDWKKAGKIQDSVRVGVG